MTKTETELPRSITIDAKLTLKGVDVLVNGESFPIVYPEDIWPRYNEESKNRLMDNVAYSSTIFLPQMLGLNSITYNTHRPISETFLFKNGIYDMSTCASSDDKSSKDYVLKFFNTQYLFKQNVIRLPEAVDFKDVPRKQKTAIVPFSFGKESMLSFALCQELGIRPILVNFIESVNDFEYLHKKQLIEDFEKETGVRVYTIQYAPSMLRYGRHWGLHTELGWGLQTTEYSFLCLPFVEYFEADYIILGNEQSCNDTYYDKEGTLTYKAGYDQHGDWATQQGLLTSMLAGRKVEVISFMEPLYEIAITRILHARYPQYGKYQMSCMADTDKAAKNRWCQNCVKCGYMYACACASGIDLKGVGFTENLFDDKHTAIFDHFFNYDPMAPAYGSQEELGLAFYIAAKAGHSGASIERFNKDLSATFLQNFSKWAKQYLGINSSGNIPVSIRNQVLAIFKEELDRFTESL